MVDTPDADDAVPPSSPRTPEELTASFFSCGPQSAQCKCECARGGPCEHQWDGKWVREEREGGGGMESSSCSRCGMLCIDHSLWLF